MILAAGRGERMRPLTDATPKPLLEVGGHALIEYHIMRLVGAGVRDIVINHAWLGEQIVQHLGSGAQFGAQITYSAEPAGALETAGGIVHALPLLGEAPFIVVNGDIWTDYPFDHLPSAPRHLAHLVLVDNPAHHPEGDFALDGGYARKCDGGLCYTYSGIGVYHRKLFDGLGEGPRTLAPLLYDAIRQGVCTAEYYDGRWLDIGTPERLAELGQLLSRA